MNQIKIFIKDKGINSQDLFRLIDNDFSESITIDELKNFLKKDLHVKKDEINMASMERLYKLMDINKHNSINRWEFEKVY